MAKHHKYSTEQKHKAVERALSSEKTPVKEILAKNQVQLFQFQAWIGQYMLENLRGKPFVKALATANGATDETADTSNACAIAQLDMLAGAPASNEEQKDLLLRLLINKFQGEKSA